MSTSRTDVAWSNAQAVAKGTLAFKTGTALLITAAAALVLIHASAWAGLPLNDLDLFVLLH